VELTLCAVSKATKPAATAQMVTAAMLTSNATVLSALQTWNVQTIWLAETSGVKILVDVPLALSAESPITSHGARVHQATLEIRTPRATFSRCWHLSLIVPLMLTAPASWLALVANAKILAEKPSRAAPTVNVM